MIDVHFWGVRGSLAAPGSTTARTGGNTSCVEVRVEGTSLYFDTGTGIRAAGDDFLRRHAKGETKRPIHVLYSHLHWDHIQGLPFFVPGYIPGHELEIHGPAPVDELERTLRTQMRPPMFPVTFDDLKADVTLREVFPGTTRRVGPALVRAARLNHPGGVLGYRVDYGGRSVVYATDNEPSEESDARLIELSQGADVLIYDSMYTPAEYRGESGPSKLGWGHSTYEDGARIAGHAGVKQLILFHHDPARDDDQVDELESRARELFPCSEAAREGSSVTLTKVVRVA